MEFVPGWKHNHWWQKGNGHAVAARGSPYDNGSAGNGGPGPDSAERRSHLPSHRGFYYCCISQRTSRRPQPHNPDDGTATCTSPGRRTLTKGEMRRNVRIRANLHGGVQYRVCCLGDFCFTRAACIFSLSFILTATTSLITQILEVHLHLLTGLLHRRLCCRKMTDKLVHFSVCICIY